MTAEVKVAEERASELRTSEVKAAEVKAAEVKAAEVKGTGVKAAEVKTGGVKSAEVRTGEGKAASVKAADVKASGNNKVTKRIAELREMMRECGVSIYYIGNGDFHNSEYVGDYFKVRQYFSGFTGSNGELLVLEDSAGLWTDGRYFVQAERELEGSGITLYKSGEEGVPSIEKFIRRNLKKGQVLGFDGRTVTASYGKKLKAAAEAAGGKCAYKSDLSMGIFKRPPFPVSQARILEDELSGEVVAGKLMRLRAKLKEDGVDGFFLSRLDDIMWLFNIRGDDVAYNPVLMSYAYINRDGIIMFIQREALTDELKAMAENNGIELLGYWAVEDFLDHMTRDKRVLVDPDEISYSHYETLELGHILVEKRNPTTILKAVKNKVERERIKDIYLKDSLALVRFIRFVEENVGSRNLSEVSAAEKLLEFRKRIPEFRELSFPTISAYKANAAMMHYEPSRERPVRLKPNGMLLVDSGGQYDGGTTDVTRTLVLGEISEEEKRFFTLSACSMLTLLNARWLYGCSGRNLDILARKRLWDIGVDYKCGTGHGIGYMLNVHEGPQSIHWRPRNNEAVLEEGMVISDEPGVYRAGKFGIRHENILLVIKDITTQDGQFMRFENLTMVPIDDKGIDRSLMTEEEKKLYLDYQKAVVEALSPYLDAQEKEWVIKYAGI